MPVTIFEDGANGRLNNRRADPFDVGLGLFGFQGQRSSPERFPLAWLLGKLGKVLPGLGEVRIRLYCMAQQALSLIQVPPLRRDLAGLEPHLRLFPGILCISKAL